LIAFLDPFLKQSQKKLVHLILSILTIPTLAQDIKTNQIVQMEELTSTEMRDRLVKTPAMTILIPIGGTEQSGPYIVLGKHNSRARYLAEKIAQQLGNAMVAPVISYVPEGSISPPTVHMRFMGTISIPPAAFNSMLEGAARSFKQHGFQTIVFLADHGGYLKNVEAVAEKLNLEWRKDQRTQVIALRDYYRLSSVGFDSALKKLGFESAEIGLHAGLADTALMMAVDKNAVRFDAMTHSIKPTIHDGVNGDPKRATAELGQIGVKLIVDGSVSAIRALQSNYQKNRRDSYTNIYTNTK
jgi:creatinine amidohydrolase/Fe(II)-dependent formamide hydrolase-like protein